MPRKPASAPQELRLRLERASPLVRVNDYLEERRDPTHPFWGPVLFLRDHVSRYLLLHQDALDLARHNNHYLRKRKKRQRGIEPEVLEIRNDFDCNSGFCVQLIIALGQLKAAESTGLRPVVNFDQTFGYFHDPQHGENVWEYYFEPVAGMSSTELDRLQPELIQRFPPPVQRHVSIGDDPRHPSVDGPETDRWYEGRRADGVRLVREYVRVRPHVLAKVDQFHASEMSGHTVLGVHIRTTDKGFRRDGSRYDFPDYAARIVPPAEYWPYVDKFIAAHPDCKIFVGTDSQQALEEFRLHYPGRVLSYGDTRSTNATNTMHVNDGRNYVKGENVLIDCLLLSRTNFLLRCQSNVGEMATFFNPDLRAIDLNRRHSPADFDPASIS
jgi:hypothetical protein